MELHNVLKKCARFHAEITLFSAAETNVHRAYTCS